MTKAPHPVLCGGTLLIQILESKRTTATQRQRSRGVFDAFYEQDVLLGLVQIVQPDYLKPAGETFKTYTTYFKRCAENTPQDLQFADEAVVSAFLSRIESDYDGVLNNMTGFVNNYIEVGTTKQKDIKLARRLIEMIVSDKGEPAIPDDYQFAVGKDGTSVSKVELATVPNIYLPAFLLGIWEFIVTERNDNRVGAATVSTWSVPNVQGRYSIPKSSPTPDGFTVDCGTYVVPVSSSVDTEISTALTPTIVQNIIMPELNPSEEIREYLNKTYKWYEKLKTLLYDKTPMAFYDFYVCNDLMYNDKTIAGATVAQLQSISHFVTLSGTGGIGKTMMMRHLLLNAIDGYDSLRLLPILIPLKKFGETTSDLLEYIHLVINQFNVNLTQAQLISAIATGSCLLLFDGMDEIRSSESMRFSHGLESLACGYPNNYFVLSSRPSWLLSRINNFCEMELQPFSKMQALRLIDNFAFSDGEEKIKDLFRTRLENDLWLSHKEFAENPLLLTIMLMTFDEYAEVPSKMYKFYEAVFETLAKKHDDTKLLAREFKSGLSKDEIAELLAKICFLSTREEKYEFTEDEFKHYFERCRRNSPEAVRADDYLHDLCGNICILQFDSGKYRFIHRSFQEYFCALNIKRTFDKVSFDKNTQLSSVLIAFFDERKHVNDKILEMLYDMAPEKVNEFIFLPKLEELLCSDSRSIEAGYWAFLEKAFQTLRCWHEYHKCIEIDEETG